MRLIDILFGLIVGVVAGAWLNSKYGIYTAFFGGIVAATFAMYLEHHK